VSHLLLVEDDPSLGATLQERLSKESHQVDWAKTKLEAQTYFNKANYDLIILDVGLPDGTGFEFAEAVRGKTLNNKVPFIFVTAMAGAEYRLKGYELGAEEYIPKPFHLKELLIRVSKVLDSNESTTNSNKQPIHIDGFVIDLESLSITKPDGEINYIPSRDCKVLSLLLDRSPNVVSRDDILTTAWASEKTPTNRSVDNCIVRLRQLLNDEQAQLIRTVRGIGYQFLEWRK